MERDRGATWEQAQMGKSTVDRVVTMGNDIRDWRERASGTFLQQTVADFEANQRFGEYVSRIGKDMLQMVSSQDTEEDQEKARADAKRRAIEARKRLRRRKVRVADQESSAESAKMDEEWDTADWSDEMVEDGVSVLFDVFYDPASRTDEIRKMRACLMLEKLISRHEVAEIYVRKNIALLVGLSANRFIRCGQSMALLDLIYILHAARTKYVPELSENNFSGRATDMLLLEARVAALQMQHMVRSHKARVLNTLRRHESNDLIRSFGSEEQTKIITESSILGRTRLLQARWNDMHLGHAKEMICTPMGYRSPIHIAPRYCQLILEIVATLVSDQSAKLAQCNREEVLRCNGCVMYAQMLGVPHGPFPALAAQILSNLSKIAESLAPIMHSGCLRAGLLCIRYFRRTGKMRWVFSAAAAANIVSGKEDELEAVARITFLDILAMFVNTSAHAAAVHRARNGFDFYNPQDGWVESIDYRTALAQRSTQLTQLQFELHLGNRFTLGNLVELLNEADNLHTIRGLLRTVYNLSCSDCFNTVLGETVACGGNNIARILSFVQEQDGTASSLALGLFLQLCTRQAGRDGLLATFLALKLAPLTRCNPVYTRRAYQRAILIAAAAIRHGPRRSYNPVKMPFLLVDSEAVRKLIYLDLLKSLVKDVELEEADGLSIPDLVLRPLSKSLSLKVSTNALVGLGAEVTKNMCDFFCHPTDDKFFESLSWDEGAAGCIIVDGLTRSPDTCRACFSSGTILYLSHCLFNGRHVIKSGPPMTSSQLMVVLSGIVSAATALSNMCRVASSGGREEEIINGLYEANVFPAVSYFINTLSQNHMLVGMELKKLQIKAGQSTLIFFDSYTAMILGKSTLPNIQRLFSTLRECGKSVVGILGVIKTVHAGTPYFEKLLEGLCSFLAQLLTRRELVEEALSDWRLLDHMRVHLPDPLTTMGELGVDDEAFRRGLGLLPASFFDLCCSICTLEKGKAACLADGFLRRAVEKALMLIPKLPETKQDMLGWTMALQKRSGVGGARRVDTSAGEQYSLDLLSFGDEEGGQSIKPPSAARLQVAAALRLAAKCASFAHPLFGSVNDLLLQPEFDIVAVCKALIGIEETPRCDPVIVASIHLLGNLSKDIYRVAEQFEALDILGLLAKSMIHVPFLPIEAAESCILAINSMGVTKSAYVVDQLRNTREPMAKIARVFPQLASAVAESQWSSTTTFLELEAKQTRLQNVTPLTIEIGRGGGGEDDVVFEKDRILREQLQKLYCAAGLDDEAERLTPQMKRQVGVESQLSSPMPFPSPSPSPSPSKSSGGRLLPLPSPSPSSSPLPSPASRPSPASSVSSFGSLTSSPDQRASPSKTRMATTHLLLSPISSPSKTVGGKTNVKKKKKENQMLTLDLEQVPELERTRPRW